MLDSMFKDTMVNMKWTEVEYYAGENALVLLPLGVIEEHGPHLCLGTDIMTAHIYCLAIKERLEQEGHAVVIAPPF
jgi:creatinine amidohydrolase